MENMNRHAANASPKERLLIETMNKRYSTDTLDRHRKELNAAYAESMRILGGKYPEDHDINALYVDAKAGGDLRAHPERRTASPYCLALLYPCYGSFTESRNSP